MNKWKKKWMLFGGILTLFSLTVCRNEETITQTVFKREMAQWIQEYAEKLYYPGILYDETEERTVTELLLENALHIVPLGKYVAAQNLETSDVEDETTYELFLKMQNSDENEVNEEGELVGKESVTDSVQEKQVDISTERLKDFDYLISKFYTVDSVTYVKEEDFNIEEMLKKDLSIKKGAGPKILIFHTHSQETFSDSKENGNQSIVDVGEYLSQLLNETYGIETIHHKGVYDKIDGKLDRSKAYELARPAIEKILKENPTIEIVIDLHRDGVGKTIRLVTEVNGKKTAQIMFFNGMCRTRTNGELEGMGNPYRETNLTFSLQMKIAAEEYYPGFTRRNYLKGYKYNMDLAPKMLLIEAGAQTNTVEEVKNAMEPLAELLNQIVGY